MPSPDSHRWIRWPSEPNRKRLGFGADYNPEQWPRETWDDDVRLMRQAGVNIVSLAIFSWARLQPERDTWNFAWLDEVIDLLHTNGIAVDLATATASPPPWLATEHPEILPVTADGAVLWPGARQHWRPTSPVFREHALKLVTAMAERYRDHPAISAWHISNELGCHNVYDYSDDAARAFRIWLTERYGTIDALNEAWGTDFWSQLYTRFDQILPPRTAPAHTNPTQQLDFKRFSSDALKQYLREERAILQRITPDIPITTNFMVMGEAKGMDYASWAAEVDFVSNDHYFVPGPQAVDELSFSANLTANIAGRKPWFLMEHSTSAVNWQPVNTPKKTGALRRDSLTHVAHGADAVCFFQWRQSKAGAEKFHSAMVPHAGEDSAIYRAVVDLGHDLASLSDVVGSRRRQAPVAIIFDWDSWWASEQDSHPSERLRYRQEALDWYSACLSLGITADVVPSSADLTGYAFVAAPILHTVPALLKARLEKYVDDGGHLATTYFSGITDEKDHIWLGGYPGAFADLLGVHIEEFGPLLDGEEIPLDNGTTATLWADRVDPHGDGVEVLARYRAGEHSGDAAVTRRPIGLGSAAYVGARLGADGLQTVLGNLLSRAGVGSDLPPILRGVVEQVVRTDSGDDYVFLINRTDAPLDITGVSGEILTNERGTLGPRSVAVLKRDAAPSGARKD